MEARDLIHAEAENFETISLKQMDRVKLMNRMDTKYWFAREHLQQILSQIRPHYYMLQIDGAHQMSYATTYFDTVDARLYTDHHNGKLNRYKIRKRAYVNSGISFLEVKFKSNKGKTNKKRIPAGTDLGSLSSKEIQFIESITPYSGDTLKTSLNNSFTRLTLVNKNFKERCTIDLNLAYHFQEKAQALGNLVIIEIKSEGKPSLSPLVLALREHRIKATGFSKYCVGKTITDDGFKRNSFKKKVRRINKIIHMDIDPFKKN